MRIKITSRKITPSSSLTNHYIICWDDDEHFRMVRQPKWELWTNNTLRGYKMDFWWVLLFHSTTCSWLIRPTLLKYVKRRPPIKPPVTQIPWCIRQISQNNCFVVEMCTRDESSLEEVKFALFGFKSNGVGMELLTNHNIWTPVSRFLFIRYKRLIIHVVDVWPSEGEASEATLMNMGKCITGTSLHWRHNEHDSISNH